MHWQTIDVEESHRDALAGHEVTTVLEGYIPWVRVTADVSYSEERPFDVLEQFVIRCLVELAPVRDAEEVGQVLGMRGETFVAPIVEELLRMQLLEKRPEGYNPTKELREAHEKGVWVDQYVRSASCICDPFTEERFTRELGHFDTDVDIAVEELPAEVRGVLGAGPFGNWVSGKEGPLMGVNITNVDITERTVLGRPCQILIFEDHYSNTWGWEPYDPVEKEVVVAYRAACNYMSATEAARNVLAERQDVVVGTGSNGMGSRAGVEDLATHDLGEVEFIQRYNTVQAAGEINDMISRAREEVLVSFPWIKGPALTAGLLSAIEEALGKGACFYIGYGIAEVAVDEGSHDDAIKRLGNLGNGKKGGVEVVWTGESHVKEIVVDRSEYMGGSFNRLSFRGDRNEATGNVRRESMIHTNNEKVVKGCVDEFVPIIRKAMLRDIREVHPSSYSEWRCLWRPLFRLAPHPEDVKQAFATLPSTGNKQVRAVEELLGYLGERSGTRRQEIVEVVIEAFDLSAIEEGDSVKERIQDVVTDFCKEAEISILAHN